MEIVLDFPWLFFRKQNGGPFQCSKRNITYNIRDQTAGGMSSNTDTDVLKT